MKKENSKILYLQSAYIIIFILFSLGFAIFCKYGDINVDSFREVYIPEQILKGQVLYKNIFNIYAPLSYIINAFLFKIMSHQSIFVLYSIGFVLSNNILLLIRDISAKFLPLKFSYGIIGFVVATGLLGTNVFNYIFPYSYGMLYGLAFILMSIHCVIKKDFFFAYFCYSLAICSKYEFLALLPVLVWYSWKKDIWKSLSGFLIPIICTAGILFLQGVNYQDVMATFSIVLKMTSAKTLHWFYGLSGLTFRWDIIPLYFINLIKIAIPCGLIYYLRNPLGIIFASILLYFFATPDILIFVFPLILILFILRFKLLNKVQIFMILASLLISMKVFWGLLLQSYGIFFIPFALLSLFILLPKKFKSSFLIVITILSFFIGIKNIQFLMSKNTKVSTSNGVIYTTKEYGDSLNGLIDFVNKNVKTDEKIIVYPEGLAVNVLTGRAADNKFYSLIPLYVETFGENLIINRLDIVKPEYIVISNYDTSNYYFSQFGEDYATDVMNYIENQYTLVSVIGEKFKYKVYKRK